MSAQRNGSWSLTPGAVDGAEPMGVIRAGDIGRALLTTARASRGGLRRGARLAGVTAKVLAGASTREPTRGDWRFADPTWSSNPIYRRAMQIYLEWCDSMDDMVRSAQLDWRDHERAQLCVSILTSALAPTNTLAGNPAALKRALETGGTSLTRGLRNRVQDLLHNGGMPAQVKRGHFTLGTDLAATPGAVVYRDEVCEVLQFASATPHVHARPVLMIPPQINKYYFMDLAPGRSFIEHAVARGIQFFTISWRNPGPGQAHWDLDTYGEAVLRAIDVVSDITRSDDVNALGLCAGGILLTAVASHLAATGEDRLKTLSLGVTLLDFDAPTTIGLFDSSPLVSVARSRSTGKGILDGPSLGSVFAWLRPNELVWNYWVNNYLLGEDPPTFDILAWNADSTNIPAALHSQFLDIFSDNVLATPGTLRVLGTPVDLGRITIENYVTGAIKDHLTPWKACYRTTQLLSGESTFVLSNAGHIASLINPPGNPKAHYLAGPQPGPDPDEWRHRAEESRGTWWEHWADWVLTRAGEERKAPTRLGSRRHGPLEPAPGVYVRGLERAA